jgi:two-component system chemotaxis response regulator CheY
MTAEPLLTALAVDDSAAMRKQLCYALQRLVGIKAEEAVDGADGWRKLMSGSYDILLTDINMPLMDGLKVFLAPRSSAAPPPACAP